MKKIVRSCCFQQQFVNDWKISFHWSQKTQTKLTLNNFTLCRGDGLHDPNMPCGKRRYVPRGSHPWRFSPRKVGPSFPAWCVCFPPLLLRGKKQLHWISGFKREKTLTKTRVKSVRNLVNFYDFFSTFLQGRFFLRWTRRVSELHPFCCFFWASQAAEAEPEEAGVWWVFLGWNRGFRERRDIVWIRIGEEDIPKLLELMLHLEAEDGRWKKHGKSEFDGCHLNPIEGLK